MIQITEIVPKLGLNEFAQNKVLSALNKKGIEYAKYVIGLPFDKNMEENNPLTYLMLYGDSRTPENDLVFINDIPIKAILFKNILSDEDWEEFLSRILRAEYSPSIRNKLSGDTSIPLSLKDKKISIHFDTPYEGNITAITLYIEKNKFKAQQSTEDSNGKIVESEKDTISNLNFFLILERAIEYLIETTFFNPNLYKIPKDFKRILEKTINESLESNIDPYILIQSLFEENFDIESIPVGMTIIHRFESPTYISEFWIDKLNSTFFIGYGLSENILLDFKEPFRYKEYSKSEFNNLLLEEIIKTSHKEGVILSVKHLNFEKIKYEIDFERYIKSNGFFDFEQLSQNIIEDFSKLNLVAVNPYTYYGSSIIIPNIDNKIFVLSQFRYAISETDFLGVVNSTIEVDLESFKKEFSKALSQELSMSIIPSMIIIEDIRKSIKTNMTFDLKGYLNTISTM